MGFKNMKRDDHGHVISNDETDGQKCQHASGKAQEVEDQKYNKEMKEAQEQNAAMSESFDDTWDEEFDEPDEAKGPYNEVDFNFVKDVIEDQFGGPEGNPSKKQVEEVVFDRFNNINPEDEAKIKEMISKKFNKANSDIKYDKEDAEKFKNAGFDVASEEEVNEIFGKPTDNNVDKRDNLKTGDTAYFNGKKVTISTSGLKDNELGGIQIKARDEDGHVYELSSRQLDKEQPSNTEPYKSKYEPEDFEDARFYPTKSTMDGPRWVGRYRGIGEAHGLDRYNDYKSFNDKFKHVEDYNNTSIYQLPDGYYSINPNITSMSFKTVDALKNYLDKKNPEEHKYGAYWDGDIQRAYKLKDENGKEYDAEGPDAYKAARKAQQTKTQNSTDAKKANQLKMLARLYDKATPEEAEVINELIEELKGK